MHSAGSLTRFVQDLHGSDPRLREEAARQIWLRFSDRLRAVVRRRLDVRLRARSDADDILQSLFADFFAANPGPSGPPKSREDLWGLLVCFTMRKVAKTAEWNGAARRDFRRDRRLTEADATNGYEFADAAALGPEDEVIACDEFANLLDLLPEDLRQIFLWKLEGLTNAEIATRIDRVERTVELKMKTIRVLLKEQVVSSWQ